jgi:hypothetical protein
MWKRNLLFLGLLIGGVGALGANLMPPREPKAATRYDAGAYQAADFRASVEKVDASFREQWKQQKIDPAQPAPHLAVARRLSLGLMGAVPSLEEIRQLESLPESERLPWWIDHILQDRRCANYLAERLARACVGTEDGPFILYRRRRFVDWLANQVIRNRPYDEVVRDLIATDGLWTDKPATNFISVTSKPDKKNQPDPIRLAGRVTRAFLGLRLDCAECHNHPFADWKQADFRGLAAFFGQTQVGFTGIHEGTGEFKAMDKKLEKERIILPRVPFSPELLPDGQGPVLNRRQRLAWWVTDRKNPYFAKAAVNRVWAIVTGRPLIEPVDNLQTEDAPPGMQSVLGILAEDFASSGFDLKRLIRVIASALVFRLDSAIDRDATDADEKTWAVFPLTRLRPEQVMGGVIQAASVTTIDSESHILVRLTRLTNQNDFVKRYGDRGEDEFGGRGGTIPQRLLLMNGTLIHERIKPGPFSAPTRLAWLAPDDPKAIESAYLAALTRRPTAEELDHFSNLMQDTRLGRAERLEEMYWALINSTEFSWNH